MIAYNVEYAANGNVEYLNSKGELIIGRALSTLRAELATKALEAEWVSRHA